MSPVLVPPPDRLGTPAARGALVAAARACVAIREEPPGSNRGRAVEAMLALTGAAPGSPWCAAFVAWCGVAACGAAWPLPRTASVAQLAAEADRKGWLLAPDAVAQAGDLVVVWFASLDRFAHVGIVTGPAGSNGLAPTVEGNTAPTGGREGWGVFPRTRALGPRDRLIRWAL